MDENPEWTYPFDYFPRGRPLATPPSRFPFMATREDWPLAREEVDGRTLTPFGGRRRWRSEAMVEIEGLLGVQAPLVIAPGQRLRFGLLLWCTNPEALAAISLLGAFQVDFMRSDTLGLDVLDPHNSARKNRTDEDNGKDGQATVGSPAQLAPNGFDEDSEAAHTVRLDGDLVIPDVTPPSYLWKYQVSPPPPPFISPPF
jgi:hypothetical protein